MGKREIIKELYILSKQTVGPFPTTFRVDIFQVTIPGKGLVRIKEGELEMFYFVGSLEPLDYDKYRLSEDEYSLLKNAFYKK